MSAVESYVDDLETALVGPRRVRRDLVQEAADHLADATDAYRRAGLDPADAERMAVADFGALAEIVPAFQTTLAVASARRTSWLLLAVLGVQPFLWDGGLLPDAPDPEGWPYAALDWSVEVLGGLSILATLVLVVATTIGNRWLHAGRAVARASAYTAFAAAASIATIAVLMVMVSRVGTGQAWLAVATCVLVPLTATVSSARRTLAAC